MSVGQLEVPSASICKQRCEPRGQMSTSVLVEVCMWMRLLKGELEEGDK